MSNSNGNWKVIATIGSFIVVIVGAAIAYGMMYKDAERTHEEVDEVKADVKVMEPKVEKNKSRIDVVDRDIDWMRRDIADIKKDNTDIKKGVDTIIQKMNEP